MSIETPLISVKGLRVVVTGNTRGIGCAIATAFCTRLGGCGCQRAFGPSIMLP